MNPGSVGRFLAVDYGTHRIGLAKSEEGLALPHRTLERSSDELAVRTIADEVRAWEIDEVVVGLPLTLKGVEGDAARRARRFAAALERAVSVPVVLWDERLTTVAADRSLREVGLDARARRRVIDQSAATVMLQCYLDSKARASCDSVESEEARTEPEDPRPDVQPVGRRSEKRRRSRR